MNRPGWKLSGNREKLTGIFLRLLYVVIVALITGWQLGWILQREIVYVSPEGHDWYPGTRERPVRRIQVALDRVQKGGEILVDPGVYSERLQVLTGGTPTQPTRIHSVVPGAARLTWELSDRERKDLKWQAEGNLFRAKIDHPVYRVVWEGQQFFRVPWGGEKSLRELGARPGHFGAFTYSEGELLVIPLDGVDASFLSALRINAPVPEPREWGEFKSANITVTADFVEISGFEMEFGIGAGVLVKGADHVQIHNCQFSGATVGVNSDSREGYSDGLQIRHCFYDNFPQGLWDDQWLSWEEVYAAYSASSLVKAKGSEFQICSCVATHVGDGLQVSPVRPSTNGPSTVENCLIAFGTDDALELDGSASGLAVLGNVFYDCHVGVSLSPILVGPVEIRKNTFLLDVKDHSYSAGVKLLPPAAFEQVARDIEIVDNLFVSRSFAWWRGCTLENFHLKNNVSLNRESVVPDLLSAMETSGNRMEVLSDFSALSTAISAERFGSSPGDVSPSQEPPQPTIRGVSWLSASTHPALAGIPNWCFAAIVGYGRTTEPAAKIAECQGTGNYSVRGEE